MADTFDPYRKWLAIPAEEQPPHHYRLLAIPLFESDPDVISNAADGRMTQIKNYQTGPYAKVSQQILNQIAAAKICLLDPKKKAVYDRRLREKLQPADKPTEAAQPSEFDFSALTSPSSPSADHGYMVAAIPRRKKSKSWVAPAVAGGALLVAGSVAAVVCMLPPQADQVASEAKKVPSPSPVPEGEPSNLPKSAFDPAAASKDSSAKKSQPHAKPPAKASVQPVETKPSDPKPKPEEEADPKQEPEPKPEQTSEPVADEKPPGDHEEMAPAKKLAIPTDEQQQTVERQVREIFQAEFAAAKTAETRSALAGKLVEQAGKSGSDVAAPYVLCRLAAQQYAAAGNLDKAMTVLDTTAARYDTDVSRLKLEILNSLLGSRAKPAAIEPDIARGIYDAAMKLTESAAATGEVEAAVQFVRIVSTAAYRSRDPELERESGKKTREIDALKARFTAVQKALDTLETDPADADANLKAGQWLCLVKGQWDRGLPMLAKGSNKALAELARQDLGTHGEAKKQVAVADAWWNLGEKEPANKAALQDRARHWYQLAMPKLAGLDKARAEKRAGTPTADNGSPGRPPRCLKRHPGRQRGPGEQWHDR